MQTHLETFQQFRQALYKSFPYRRDSLLELLDALSSNERAQSPVELSLNSCFQRKYGAVYQAIQASYEESEVPVCSLEAYRQGESVLATIPKPQQKHYTVFGIDETPNERLYAQCLSDRQNVHRSTQVPGQVPISLGHNYSVLAVLPEGKEEDWQRWSVPVSVERVSSLSNAIEVAQGQIAQLLSYRLEQDLGLKVVTLDSRYPTAIFLYGLRDYKKLVTIARVRSSRVFYRQPEAQGRKTRPRWYGETFRLQDATTWSTPTEQYTLSISRANGSSLVLSMKRWTNLLMRSTRKCPMHKYPFDLVQIQRLDEQGQPSGRPQWLLVYGQQRHTLSVEDIQQAYSRRFNLEHFFGFAKPHLLLTASQTCHTAHEINWVRLACLAHVQLWLARHLVDSLPLPWQRYSPLAQTLQRTPRQIQRGFSQLIRQIGTLATTPKPRGIPSGRTKGTQLTPRCRRPIVKFHPPRKRCPCKKAKDAA